MSVFEKTFLHGSDEHGVRAYLNQLFRLGDLRGHTFSSLRELETKSVALGKERGDIETVVITGSAFRNYKTNTRTLDYEAVCFARKQGIRCISVVEHWNWFEERFRLSNDLVLPDSIWVNDQRALEVAALAGIPEDLVFALGNPVLEAALTKSSSPLTKSETEEYAAFTKLLPPREFVLFISENLREDARVTGEPMHPFDEYRAFRESQLLADALGKALLVKLHPTDEPEKYGPATANTHYLGGESIDVRILARMASVIITMGSMLSIELGMVGANVWCLGVNEDDRSELGSLNPEEDKVVRLPALWLSRPKQVDLVQQLIGSTKRIRLYLDCF